MSASASLNSCGCCEGIGVETPVAIHNRPGLPAIAYQVGTYANFRESLLARLSESRFSVLRQLRSRDNDDFTIALLDAWAVTSDVLTFYQERIANESYLRTATERLSILEQSRLIGYQLSAGLAASTYLAFTMEEAIGAPQQSAQPLQLPVGTRAQSVPGPDEQPQIFETIEAIDARVEWNGILPQLTDTQTLTPDMTALWLEGANLTLAVGDVLLIIAPSDADNASLRRVTKVTPDPSHNRTKVTLAMISETAGTITTERPGVFVMRTIASPFGHNAPKEATYDKAGVFTGFQEWTLDSEPTSKITLSARYDKILEDSWLVIEQNNPDDQQGNGDNSDADRLWIFSKVTGVIHRSVAKYGIAGSVTRLTLETEWKKKDDSKLGLLRSMNISAQPEPLTVSARPLAEPLYGAELSLNGIINGLVAGRPLALSGKRQRLRIRNPAAASFPKENSHSDIPVLDGLPDMRQIPDIDFPPSLFLDLGNSVSLAAPPEKLLNSNPTPLTPEEFGAALTESEPPALLLDIIDRNGSTGRIEISAAEIDLVASGDADEIIREIALIDDNPTTAITHFMNRTTLQIAAPLANVYERGTVRINANVAAATHGESVKELLGSGDATITYQSFTLRQPPLTYVSAATPSGSASTLKVFVNDVLWQEAPFFYGQGANEHIYVTERDDEGRTTIRFGDGINGARLPTGQNNVRAEYRKGTGLGGLVEAGQLSQLLSRPLGLKEVVNPEAAEGAENPESRDDARKNAPTTVLTLDRAVSLQDYEDFARTFAGIAKAQAVWVWDGRKRSIFLTVAGADGEVLEEDGAVIAKLKESLREYGDPFVAFTIKSYRQALFQIHGTMTIHADHVIDTVMAAVTADLSQRYSFDARTFGQPVALSETIAAIQAIPGVVAVDADKFYRNDEPTPDWRARLDADRPAMGADGIVAAAELLLLDTASLSQLKVVYES
jgi:hypothetical protein